MNGITTGLFSGCILRYPLDKRSADILSKYANPFNPRDVFNVDAAILIVVFPILNETAFVVLLVKAAVIVFAAEPSYSTPQIVNLFGLVITPWKSLLSVVRVVTVLKPLANVVPSVNAVYLVTAPVNKESNLQ